MFVRKFIFLVVIAVGVCSTACWAVDNPEEARQVSVSSTNSVAKSLSALIEQIRSNHRANSKDCTRLQLIIGELGGDKLSGAEPSARQQIVRDILGAEHYKMIEEMLSSQLNSADADLRNCAIWALGQSLFSASSVASLKDIVFGPDREAQFFALTSLVALGTPGANDLLTLMLLSETLTDPMATDAIQVLLLSDTSLLTEHGLAIMVANKGPLAVKALLPALKLRKDYQAIVTALFRSDIGRVPDEEQLTLMDHAKLTLEFALLTEMQQNFAVYSHDSVVKRKVLDYAKSRVHYQIYTVALITLERSGEGAAYFEQMLEDKTLPEKKVGVLNRILNRIRLGQGPETSEAEQ